MGKTSEKKTTQEIDPALRREAKTNMDATRALIGGGYNPFVGNTIADFTPAQRAAFQGTDMMAQAFGLPGGAAQGGPTGATEGAYGIMGFSPETVMQTESPIPPEYLAVLDRFYQMMSGGAQQVAAKTPQQIFATNTGTAPSYMFETGA